MVDFFDMALALFIISIMFPGALSDENDFLNEFVGGDYLSTLGFIIALTEASAVNIYAKIIDLEISNQIQLPRSKRAVRRSAFSLILIFAFAIFVVVAKGSVDLGGRWETFWNITAIILLYSNLSVIYDLTRTSLRDWKQPQPTP